MIMRFFLPLWLTFASFAQALDVGDISTFMHSDADSISKTIRNSTDTGRLMTVRVTRISSPLESGVEIPFSQPDELLLTPARLLMPAQSTENIRFFITGQKMPRSAITAFTGLIRH